MDQIALSSKWRHKLYKIFFFLFVIMIIVAIVELQPTADVPAPTIYGIGLIFLVDLIYYELIVRMITGKPAKGMVKRYFSW